MSSSLSLSLSIYLSLSLPVVSLRFEAVSVRVTESPGLLRCAKEHQACPHVVCTQFRCLPMDMTHQYSVGLTTSTSLYVRAFCVCCGTCACVLYVFVRVCLYKGTVA